MPCEDFALMSNGKPFKMLSNELDSVSWKEVNNEVFQGQYTRNFCLKFILKTWERAG